MVHQLTCCRRWRSRRGGSGSASSLSYLADDDVHGDMQTQTQQLAQSMFQLLQILFMFFLLFRWLVGYFAQGRGCCGDRLDAFGMQGSLRSMKAIDLGRRSMVANHGRLKAGWLLCVADLCVWWGFEG